MSETQAVESAGKKGQTSASKAAPKQVKAAAAKGDGAKTKAVAAVKGKESKAEGKAATAPVLAKKANEVPEVVGSEAEFKRFMAEAEAIDAKEVKQLRANASLAYHNSKAATDAVLAHAGHIQGHMPHVDLKELADIPNLALAVAFGALLAEREVGASSDVKAKLNEAYNLRRLLLSSAKSLAEAEIFSGKEVEKIETGKGHIDAVNDCIALASMFTKRAAGIKGKTPVGAKQVMRAAELGTELKTLLKTKGAKKSKNGVVTMSAGEARDRLYTLLVQRYERLWAVGAYIFGYAVSEQVPTLLAQYHKPKSPKKPNGEG